MAGQREPQGVVDINLIITDLLGSVPTYSTGFNSGNDTFRGGGNKSNRSSAGRHLWRRLLTPPTPRAAFLRPATALRRTSRRPPLAVADDGSARKPRGNQSSIEGGIFGNAAPLAPPAFQPLQLQPLNQSSIQGGETIAFDARTTPSPDGARRGFSSETET